MSTEQDFALRAAWLAYVGHHTQEAIAERLGITRVKVQRMVAAAVQEGLVKVFVEGVPVECMALEDALMKRFGLEQCIVVPDLGGGARGEAVIPGLAAGAARYLTQRLSTDGPRTIGVGHGRTLAATIGRLPAMQLPQTRFVSLLGSLTRRSTANPFDVIAQLAQRTGGECYFLPVPFVADSVADAQVLYAQRSVQEVIRFARECSLCVVGIGGLGEESQWLRNGTLSASEMDSVLAAGAVGELGGRFIAADGSAVSHELNQRAVAVPLDDLKGREVLAIAGGLDKTAAIAAVLHARYLTSLIVDEATAKAVIQIPPDPG